jgi:hypothetical protein
MDKASPTFRKASPRPNLPSLPVHLALKNGMILAFQKGNLSCPLQLRGAMTLR